MSEVKVNKISPRTACGTTTLGDSGDTFNVPCGSKINVASGGSLTVASGATITNSGTATGFGATGAVNWDTASIKTATFTAVSGSGYFCNTTAGVFNITMPLSPSAGDIVGLKDYAGTFATYNLTVDRNGSKLDSNAANRVLDTNNRSLTMIYVDGTQGWKSVEEGTGYIGELPAYIVATGGTPCTGAIVCTDYKVHTFTGPGNFCVSCLGNAGGSNTVDYIVIAGGGAGAGNNPSAYTDGSGGGGAGGTRFSDGTTTGCYTAGPAPLSASALPVAATCYSITVGGGGSAASGPGTSRGGDGNNSIFSSITSTAGGGGGTHNYPPAPAPNKKGNDGGSGGGPGGGFSDPTSFGAGNTPPVSPAQGTNSGAADSSPDGSGAGGGGAVGPGTAGSPSRTGDGGIGITNSITASAVAYAGGGGGAAGSAGGFPTGGFGGFNPGGCGPAPQVDRYGAGNGVTNNCGIAATANTGGGGGAGAKGNTGTSVGGGGGSGVVVIRYKFQN